MKKSLKFYFALFTAKCIILLQKLLKMRGTHFAGKMAIKLCPDFLGMIDKPKCIIGVTGTNGKTTVCNLLIDILKANGVKLLDNNAGANTNAGIASALIKGAGIFGKTKYSTAILEIDERSSIRVFPYIKPTYLICTNLFRDSIRRNAHAEYIFDMLNKTLPDTTKLILNADDLISSQLKINNDRVYFSIDKLDTDYNGASDNIINDIRVCPNCYAKLDYEYSRYHHIGKAHCSNCGFASPRPNYLANVNFDNMTMNVKSSSGSLDYHLISNSIFNAYNQLAAIAFLREYGFTDKQIADSFKCIKIVESRYSSVNVNGIEVITNMTKGQNPVACSCVFKYVSEQDGNKEVVLMLDDAFDRKDSSENMTWIYDADFEFLNRDNITNIIVTGVRCSDYKLRLLIAGVDESKIQTITAEADAHKLLKLKDTDKIYILHEMYVATEMAEGRKLVIDKVSNGGAKL